MALGISTKQLQIDKASIRIVAAVSIATFLVVFSLIAGKSLLSQQAYQAKLISKKQIARDTLDANIKSTDKLVEAYKQFIANPENVIGGSSSGTGKSDGDNARIVLDALPSKYDYPALTTSLDKVLTGENFKINSITGADDGANQAANQQSASPQPVEMPFEVSVNTDFSGLQSLLQVLERSIRPIQVQSLTITGAENRLTTSVKANTYYQPEKVFQIKKEVVK